MCAGKVCLPVVHQPPPTLEQVRPRVGGLDPVADDVRQRGLDDHQRVVIEAAQSRKLDRKPCGTAAMPKFPSRSDRHVPLTGLPQRFGNTSGSSSGGSAPSLPPGQRWSASRKRDVVLRLLRGESLDAVSRAVGVELYRLEAWKGRALAGLELGLKDQAGEPVAAALDAAKRHIGELSMENELLRERARAAERRLPLPMRRSR